MTPCRRATHSAGNTAWATHSTGRQHTAQVGNTQHRQHTVWADNTQHGQHTVWADNTQCGRRTTQTTWCGQQMAKDSLAKDHKGVLEYLVTSVGTMGTTHGSAPAK